MKTEEIIDRTGYITGDRYSNSDVPREVNILARRLSSIHGPYHIAHEASGWHIYIPSPYQLAHDGRREIYKRHLAINAEKFAAIGEFEGDESIDNCARCMKSGRHYLVSELMEMPTLEDRGIKEVDRKGSVVNSSLLLVEDENGNMVPDMPGECIPLPDLPKDHPAVFYLRQRGYDISKLSHQFDVMWCEKEKPQDPEKGLFYKRLPGGFKDTPQGRIIFFCYMNGVRRGWQARILDIKDDKAWWYWHPYNKRWVAVAERTTAGQDNWTCLPGFQGFDPAKYKTANGSQRNQMLMGLDAALSWNLQRGESRGLGVLAEGPLDAGRVGPPAIPLLGKSVSQEQARLLAAVFSRLIVVRDNDAGGKFMEDRAKKMLEPTGIDLFFEAPLEGCKDLGEMTDKQTKTMMEKYLND